MKKKRKKKKTALRMQMTSMQDAERIAHHEDTVEMEELKEEIKLTRLGRMLYDDGKIEGERIGEERGESKIMTLIQRMSADGALELIPRLTTDSEFFQAMAEKYSVDI